MDVLRYQLVPLVLAVAIHAGALLALMGGWNPERQVSQVIKPQIVNSKLMVLEPKAKPKAAPKPAPAPPAPKKTTPKPKPKPKPIEKKPLPDPEALRREAEEKIRAQREKQRQERLQRLADQSFADALAQEAEELASLDDDAVAQSYRQGIYELIVANWSRPPSARNGMKARLLVELVPTGEVVGVSVVDTSGNGAFDRSAEQAVRKAQKFDVPDDLSLFEQKFRRFYLLFQPEDLLR